MAEAFGIFAGAAGLVGLFTPCVECFEYVQFGRKFGKDYETRLVKLDVVRLRLARWGVSVGLVADPTEHQPSTLISPPRASDAELELVKSILGQIMDAFDEVKTTSLMFKTKAEKAKSTELAFFEASKRYNILQKTAWALYEKKKFDRLIENVTAFVDTLEKEFPGAQERRSALCVQELSEIDNPEGLKLLGDIAGKDDLLLTDAVTTALANRGIIYRNSDILIASNVYSNIHISGISGNARVLLGPSSSHVSGSDISARADYVGQYAHSSLRPVANYVLRPKLQQKIKEQLHDALETAAETRTLVVHGLGGSGKSQLALNYIREYRLDYTAVFWIEAGQKESIERDFIQIHRLLFAHTATEAGSIKLEDAVPAVKSWFYRQSGRSLVVLDSADIIDNADDPSYIDLEYFLPDASSVDIIITTRSSRAQEMTTLEAVDVAEMEDEEAAELFRKCAKLGHITVDIGEEVHKIVKELGKLALAITLAGSYVAATPRLSSDLQQYLPELRKRRKELLSVKATKHIHRYGESVLSTWETSFSAVVRQSPLASRFLTLLAFLNFDDIFLDLFITGTDPVAQGQDTIDQRWRVFISPEACLDRYGIESAFAVLQTYSLVQWRSDQETYTMHSLVHAWGRERLETDQQQEPSLAALGLLTAVIPAYRRNLAYGTRLVPHVMANFQAVSAACMSPYSFDTTGLGRLGLVGNFLRGLGLWSDEYQIRSFHFRKSFELVGEEHPSTLTGMNNLATVLSHQGKYEQAEEMHRRALELTETVQGKEHPNTLTSMNNLATVLSDQGKYEQAEEICRRMLEVKERALGKEHPYTLMSMSNLADVYWKLERWVRRRS